MATRSGMYLAMLLLAGWGLTGCSLSVPSDPHGTLAAVTGGTLRVGVTANAEWVELPEGAQPDLDPQGVEPDLVRDFAAGRQADIAWSQGSEAALVDDLKHGELDLVIGGLADDTPWSKDAGMTRPYRETTDERGKTVKHIMLVRHGENAFLVALDTFLLEQAAA